MEDNESTGTDLYNDDAPPVFQLEAAVERLISKMGNIIDNKVKENEVILQNSPAQPVLTSRFSRFEELRFTGIAPLEESIYNKSVGIIGIGGIGGLVADIICRSGVKKLVLIDNGNVNMESMGRMFYSPSQTNMNKLQAARLSLRTINPYIIIKTLSCDITNSGDCNDAKKFFLTEGLEKSTPVDLIISLVDNSTATKCINEMCLGISIPLINAYIKPCSTVSYFRLVIPGFTSCLECINSSGQDEESIEIEDGVNQLAPSVLPQCELITAGLVSSNALKYLLNFGDVIPFFQYNSISNTFEYFSYKPNLECKSPICQSRQEEAAKIHYK